MYISHPDPDVRQLIKVTHYADIRCCNKNLTHVDFYEKPQAEGERGNPDLTLEFSSEKERNEWYENLVELLYATDLLLEEKV